MAGVYFTELLTRLTPAEKDQEHLDFLLYSRPSTPDRTAFLLGRSEEDPGPVLADSAGRLERAGAEVLALSCMTSHYYLADIRKTVGIPVLDGPLETARALKERGVERAGIMATEGSLYAGLFQKALEDCGISPVAPDEAHQKMVMEMIYGQAKAGKPLQEPMFFEVCGHLKDRGARAMILGCTELSFANKEGLIPENRKQEFVDSLETLARACIRECH